MAPKPGIHWKTPTTIALAFLAGLAFAIAHHVFYASLAGTAIDDGTFDQQLNLAIGNGFAFLVRAALTMSIAATYWQVFWRTLLDKSYSLETADSLASLLSSIIDILTPQLWAASPLLVCVAAVAWLVPFATVVPPATLTVGLSAHISHSLMAMKTPDFLGTSMGWEILEQNNDDGPNAGAPAGYLNWNTYNGPTPLLTHVLESTAFDGRLPNLPAPAPNASYVLSYPAPTIQCETMPVDVLSQWAPVMGCDPSLQFNGEAHNYSACDTNANDDYLWFYLAWTPSDIQLVPFPPNSLPIAGDLSFGKTLEDNSGYLGSYNSSASNLFIAASVIRPYVDYTQNFTWYAYNCSLYNSTYKVNFTFQESIQTVTVLDVNVTEPIAPVWSSPQRLYNESLPAAIGSNMNYQALMDVLGRLLVGDIGQGGTAYQTQILQTALAYTTEMRSWGLGAVGSAANTSQWYQRSLADAVESLFENMTLSLFSHNELLQDADGNTTDVAITNVRNVYTYHWQRLWLAYGLALGFTLLIVAIGCSSVAISGTSYSNRLSTIVRVTGGDDVDVDIKPGDRAGEDPLPEYLGKAKLLCSTRGVADGSKEPDSLLIAQRRVDGETSAMIQRPRFAAQDP